MKELKGTIENWIAFVDNPNKEPHFHIMGEYEGKVIVTSRVISIDENSLETNSSIYTLGTPKLNWTKGAELYENN